MLKIRQLHAIILLPVMTLTLLTSACLGIGAGASVSYTPPFPFPPITISIDTNGNIAFHAAAALVTEIGTFAVEANVFSSLKPEDNVLLLVIRHKQNGKVVDEEYKIQTGQDEVRVTTNGTTTVDVTLHKVFIDASKGSIQSIEVKDSNSPSTAIAAQTPIPTPSPTPTPSPIPTATPTPILVVPSQLSGTLNQNGYTTFQVSLQVSTRQTDGSFEGKWFAMIGDSQEDVFVHGVSVPFNESNQFNQMSQDKVYQLQQHFGSDGTLLWFTSTDYDVGQDILLRCDYYGLLQPNGTVQGIWYAPGSDSDDGTFQLK